MKPCIAIVLLMTIGCAGDTSDHHPADTTPDSHDAVHWGYGPYDGPEQWGDLNPTWALCATGTAQSPIDVRYAGTVSDEERMALDLPETSVRIVRQEHVLDVLDNGHTIQVNVDAFDTLTIGDTSFALVQYHFHAPSEHTVNGAH